LYSIHILIIVEMFGLLFNHIEFRKAAAVLVV